MQLGVIPMGRFSGAFPSRKDVSTSVRDVTRRETRQGLGDSSGDDLKSHVWCGSIVGVSQRWNLKAFMCVWVNNMFIF